MSSTSTANHVCPVCHEEYTTPIILTCKQEHMLCLSCAQLKAQTAHAKGRLRDEAAIERLLAKTGSNEEDVNVLSKEGWDTFPCPVCGEAVAYNLAAELLGLSVKAAESVPGDYDSGTSKAAVLCVACESRIAEVYCRDCEEPYCPECVVPAHRASKMKSHTIEPLSSVSLKKPMTTTPLCREHNKPLNRSCIKDKVPVCMECLVSGQHREKIGDHWVMHECQSVAEALRLVTEDLQAGIVRCEIHQRAVDESHVAVSQAAARLFTSYSVARTSVETYFGDVIGRLESMRDEKLKEVDTIYQKQHALYESQISLLGSARVVVRETLSIGRRVLKKGEADGAVLLQQRQSAMKGLEEARSLCSDKLVPVMRSVGLSSIRIDATEFIEKMRTGIACYLDGIHELRVRPQSQTSTAECPLSVVADAYNVRGQRITDVVTSSGAAGLVVTVYAQLGGDGGVRCDMSVVRERDSFVARWPSSASMRDGKWQVYYALSGSAPRLLTEYMHLAIRELRVRPPAEPSSVESRFTSIVEAYDLHGERITDLVTSGGAVGSAVTVYAQLSTDGSVRRDLSVIREQDSFTVRWPSSGIRDGKWQVYYVVGGSPARRLMEFRYESVKYRFDANSVSDDKALAVSADDLTVRHNGPDWDHSVLGPLLPNHGRHTWRLRMSGAPAGVTNFYNIFCGVTTTRTTDPKQCYTWSMRGFWTRGDGQYQQNNAVCTFPRTATPELELTLDSDQHTLTMRRLDNGQTHSIGGVPENVFVCVLMGYRGNTATFI